MNDYAAAERVPYEAEARKRAAMASRLLKLRLIRLHYEHAPKEIKDQHLPVVYREIEKIQIRVPMPPKYEEKATPALDYSLPPVSFDRGAPLKMIVETVARYFRVESWKILGPRRTIDLVVPRHVAMFLAVECSDLSYGLIAGYFRRDHTVIMHAKKRVAERAADDHLFKIKVETIRAQLAVAMEMPTPDHVARMREMASRKFSPRAGAPA